MMTETELQAIKPVRHSRKISDGGGLYLLVTPEGGRCCSAVQTHGMPWDDPVTQRVRSFGLRFVQGSALDRLLSDKGLRSRMASELAKNDVKNELTDEAQTALIDLDTAFKKENLPAGLDLAITGGQGASIASMIGLTADRHGVQLPLASWGAGTRRLSNINLQLERCV